MTFFSCGRGLGLWSPHQNHYPASSHIVYPLFFLNSVAKNYRSSVTPLEGVTRCGPPPSDATVYGIRNYGYAKWPVTYLFIYLL